MTTFADLPPAGVQPTLLDKWSIYDHPAVAWEPHPAQLAIEEDHTRHQVVAGGRRLGKSNIGGHRLIPCAFLAHSLAEQLRAKGKRHEYWIVGPEYSDGEKEFRVFWNALQRLEIPMDKPGSYNLPLSGQMHVSLWDGAFQVHVKSAKDPDRLVGEELTGVIMAEAAKQKPMIWTKYIRPMLLDQKGWSLHTSTPEGKNHFYDKHQRGQKASDPDWASWRIPSWYNTHIFTEPTRTADVMKMLDISRERPGLDVHDIVREYGLIIDPEILDIAGELTVETFKQEIAADFTEFVGKVFKDFDTEYHCGTLKFHPDWETFACVDYGFRHPNVWLLGQYGPDGEINFLDEVYIFEHTPLDFAKEIRRRGLNPSSLTYMYPDPARPDSTAVLEEELMVKSKGATGGEIQVRLDLIRKALKRGILDSDGVYKDGRKIRPQMMFDWKCSETINDFEMYKYPEKKDERQEDAPRLENPMKIDDDGPEAVGRFMVGKFGQNTVEPAQSSRVSAMKMNTGSSAPSIGPVLTRQPQGKPERYMRITDHEPVGWEYKVDKDDIEEDTFRAYYD